MNASDSAIGWVVIVAQLVGLMSVGIARLTERSSSVLPAQAFFLLALLAVGATTLVTLSSGSGTWLFTGATLPIMVVGATLDLGTGSEAPTI